MSCSFRLFHYCLRHRFSGAEFSRLIALLLDRSRNDVQPGLGQELDVQPIDGFVLEDVCGQQGARQQPLSCQQCKVDAVDVAVSADIGVEQIAFVDIDCAAVFEEGLSADVVESRNQFLAQREVENGDLIVTTQIREGGAGARVDVR